MSLVYLFMSLAYAIAAVFVMVGLWMPTQETVAFAALLAAAGAFVSLGRERER
jgi:hypothetical protein